MIHVSSTDLRKNLAHYMDRAHDDRDAILITRQGSEPCIMVAQSEWEGMLETLRLRSSPETARRLDESIAALNGGEGFEVVWDEKTRTYIRA